MTMTKLITMSCRHRQVRLLPKFNDHRTLLSLPHTSADGGYGWVIVIASFLCNMVVDGIAYTFGVFLNEFVADFNEGPGKVAWVGSLLSGMYLTAGENPFRGPIDPISNDFDSKVPLCPRWRTNSDVALFVSPGL